MHSPPTKHSWRNQYLTRVHLEGLKLTNPLSRGDDDICEMKAGGESFKVSKAVLCKHSEYFETCFNGEFSEARKGIVQFEDVDPKYLALYVGLCYSFSTLVPHAPPPFSETPEATAPETPLKDYVEVYKLCDRFLSVKMADYMIKCIDKSIGDGHRALFRVTTDDAIQKMLMRDFADGYEALDDRHARQVELAAVMVRYFCDGVRYTAWREFGDEVKDRPRFVAHVSRMFADKLAELQATKKMMRRKELGGPG